MMMQDKNNLHAADLILGWIGPARGRKARQVSRGGSPGGFAKNWMSAQRATAK